MPKISALTPAGDLTGDETVVMVKGGKTRRGSIGALVGAAVAPHVEQAIVSASAAAAYSNFIAGTLIEAEALTEDGERFSISEDGVLIAYLRTAIGSTEIARAVTPASLQQPNAADGIGTVEGMLDRVLLNRLRVIHVDNKGAVGDCVPGGPEDTIGTDDTAAINAAIDELWDFWAKYVEYRQDLVIANPHYAIGGPTLIFGAGKCYRANGELRSPPPGTSVYGPGATVCAGASNIRLFSLARDDSGAVTLPDIAGGTAVAYGSSFCEWLLPHINCNGHAGTFVCIDTANDITFHPMHIYGATGSSYELTGAVVENKRFVGLTPEEFDQVKIGDCGNGGNFDPWGNPWPYLVVDKDVANPAATDRTYGFLKLDEDWQGATGEVTWKNLSVPLVTMKLQQSSWIGRSTFKGCDWAFYHGRNRDEITTGSEGWYNDQVDAAYGFNDCKIGELFTEACHYGGVFGAWTVDFEIERASMQFNLMGSHLIHKGIMLKAKHLRFEHSPEAPDNTKPDVVFYQGAKGHVDHIHVGWNGIARKLLSIGSFCEARVGSWGSATGTNVPTMPGGGNAAFSKLDGTSQMNVKDAMNTNGPGDYLREPWRWCDNGAGGHPGFGYTGIQTAFLGVISYTTAGEVTWVGGSGDFEIVAGQKRPNDPHYRYAIRNDGNSLYGNGLTAPNGSIGSDGTNMYFGNSAAGGTMQFNKPIVTGGETILGLGRGDVIERPSADVASLHTCLITLLDALSAGGHHPLFDAP